MINKLLLTLVVSVLAGCATNSSTNDKTSNKNKSPVQESVSEFTARITAEAKERERIQQSAKAEAERKKIAEENAKNNYDKLNKEQDAYVKLIKDDPTKNELFGSTKNHEKIIHQKLKYSLVDYDSAKIELEQKSKSFWIDRDTLKVTYGYLYFYKINAKNRMGGYTGYRSHGFLLHNDEMLFSASY